MSLDTQVRTRRGSPDSRSRRRAPWADAPKATITFRWDVFVEMTAVVGCRSDEDRARLLGMTAKTLGRVRMGRLGEAFIAQVLYVLGLFSGDLKRAGYRPTFEQLFEVVPDEAEDTRAAS
jgi:hypothetical protein